MARRPSRGAFANPIGIDAKVFRRAVNHDAAALTWRIEYEERMKAQKKA